MRHRTSAAGVFTLLMVMHYTVHAAGGPVVSAGFVADEMPTPSCHASTLAVAKDGTRYSAWFGGKAEGDKSVTIWLARKPAGAAGFEKPVEVATGVVDQATRYPCWNPVLFQPATGPLLLFYKVGPSPSKWWGMLIKSEDAGRTWSAPQRLPDGILGPIKNKPIELVDGTIICPTSSEHDGWRLHFEFTKDLGKTWEKTDRLGDDQTPQAIQPTLLRLPGGKLELLARPRKAGQGIQTAISNDNGRTWGAFAAIMELPNPNSGIDAVTLADGRHVLIYNHTPKGRTPLNVAISTDGQSWKSVLTLEKDPGEYSYPAVIQSADGKVHVSYTWKRQKVKYVVLDAAELGK